MGITMATTILVSQYYGAKDYKMVEKAAVTSFPLSIVLGHYRNLDFCRLQLSLCNGDQSCLLLFRRMEKGCDDQDASRGSGDRMKE